MDNVVDLVNLAMEDWDQETKGGLTDPVFQGELGQEIDLLVDSLNQEEVNLLLRDKSPLFFMEGDNGD